MTDKLQTTTENTPLVSDIRQLIRQLMYVDAAFKLDEAMARAKKRRLLDE